MGGKSGKKQTVGYKYYLGMHQVLCHGPIDNISRITVDDREAWTGVSTGGAINVNKPSLFGGDGREGGVSGTIDIEMGGPAQGQNSYLVARLGALIPAYRGVVSAIFRQCYLGNNPYLKPWRFRGQRVHVRQNGIAQWYDSTAMIPLSGVGGDNGLEDFAAGLDAYTLLGGSKNDFEIINTDSGRAMVTKSVTNLGSNIRRVGLANVKPTYIRFDFRVDSRGNDDTGRISFIDATGDIIFQFIASRQASFDAARRGRVHSGAITGSGGGSVIDHVPDIGTWYTLQVALNWDANTYAATMYEAGEVVATRNGSTGLEANMVGLQFGVDANSSGFGQTTFRNIVFYSTAPSGDMNPIHMIRECLTDPDWGMGYTDDDIGATFSPAADKLYDEGLGMSLLWDRQIKIEEFVDEIKKHIDAAVYVSRKTGKFEVKLIRNDYDVASLVHLDESNIARIDDPKRAAFGELINSVTVNYWDRTTGKNASLTVTDTAMVQEQGSVINTTLQYPGFTNARNATIAAQRDLRGLSSAGLSCTIYTDRTAEDLNVGDAFKLSWSKWGLTEVVMRVTGIAFGTGRSNQIRITCTEDVYSTAITTVVSVPDPVWENPSSPPGPSEDQLAVEAPYFELVQAMGTTAADTGLTAKPDSGFVMAAASRAAAAINARLWTDSGAGYEDVGALDFCPTATLTTNIGKLDETFTVDNMEDLGEVVLGTHVQVGNELMRVDALNTTTGVMTVGRGVLDTVPEDHIVGDMLFFWDAYAGFDPTEYVEGEEVGVKITPVSGSGQLDLADAIPMTVELGGRAWRPYAPGDLRINGDSYEDELYQGELALTWTHRDRIQQTGGVLIDHTAGDIGPEVGTVYRVRGYMNGVLDHEEDDIAGTAATWTPTEEGIALVEVHAKRDGVYSWQAPSHTFYYTSGDVRLTAAGDERITEDGELRVTED